jgi:hypothetical protein
MCFGFTDFIFNELIHYVYYVTLTHLFVGKLKIKISDILSLIFCIRCEKHDYCHYSLFTDLFLTIVGINIALHHTGLCHYKTTSQSNSDKNILLIQLATNTFKTQKP